MNGRGIIQKGLLAMLALSMLALFMSCVSAGAVELSFKLITPPGIKWADLPQGPVLVTAEGLTIYKKLPKTVGTWGNAARQTEVVGTCVYQCPTEWPPVKAPADAKPVGDFTVVTNTDGVKVWAYKGIELETFIFDKKPGDTKGQDTYAFNGPRIPIGEAAWIESDVMPAKPAPLPEPSAARPPAVSVQVGLGGNRYFTDSQGATLYTYDGGKNADCTGKCLAQFHSVGAGAIARPIGDWTVVAHDDGTRQWAYKGKPVFAYINETTPGVPMADGLDGKWHAAVEYQAPLPPEVGIRTTDTYRVYSEKASGRSLYIPGYKHRPYEYLSFNKPGVLFGTIMCYNECAKKYPPLLASANAKPMGEWWILTRADGAKQWAFRGIPVYTYSQDTPGRNLADDTWNRTWTELPANNPPSLEDQ